MLTFKEYKVPVELLVKRYLRDAANFIKVIIQTDKHVDTHTLAHACTHTTHTHTHTHTHTRARMHSHTTHTHTHTRACMHSHTTHTHTRARMHSHTHHTHTHTHVHAHTHSHTTHTHTVVRVCVCICTYISDITQDRFSHIHKAIMGQVVPDNLL
jgi:hypothetical protein